MTGTQKAGRTSRRALKSKAPTPKTDDNDVKDVHSSTAGGLTWSNIVLGLFVAILTVSVNHYYIVRRSASPTIRETNDSYISRNVMIDHKHFPIRCHRKKQTRDFIPGCHKIGKGCGRAIRDHFVGEEDVLALREIAEIGMRNHSKRGGPTIMDINTGFVKSGDGLVNIYQSSSKDQPIPRFTEAQFALYRHVIENIRRAVMQEFNLDHLYFTAPTFITRIVGNTSWSPSELHDEYWHPHVDKDNTAHYDYSGLLYLSDYDVEFTGGLFAFLPKKKTSKAQSTQVVEPARGRLMMFSSGKENLHQVRQVETGIRYVMSMWFTCDERRHFHTFLDGNMHVHFKKTE